MHAVSDIEKQSGIDACSNVPVSDILIEKQSGIDACSNVPVSDIEKQSGIDACSTVMCQYQT